MSLDPINSITKVRLPDGSEAVITDWSDKPIYSSIDVLNGMTDQEIRAFSYTAGDTVASSANIPTPRIATSNDTNASNASEMDATEEMLVYGISIEAFQYPSSAGVRTSPVQNGQLGRPFCSIGVMGILQSRFVVALEVSLKDFAEAGFGYFPAGFGAFSAGNNLTGISTVMNGLPTQDAVHMMTVPVHIGGTEKYSLNFVNPTNEAILFPNETNGAELTSAYLTIRAYLRGLHKRPTA